MLWVCLLFLILSSVNAQSNASFVNILNLSNVTWTWSAGFNGPSEAWSRCAVLHPFQTCGYAFFNSNQFSTEDSWYGWYGDMSCGCAPPIKDKCAHPGPQYELGISIEPGYVKGKTTGVTPEKCLDIDMWQTTKFGTLFIRILGRQ